MATLTKADMIDRLTIRLRMTRQDARKLVDTFFGEISQSLADGKEVKLSGFGNFELKDKKSRPGRNPKTGEVVAIKARRVVTFKAGQKFRRQIEVK
ncbi:integration host factor subunit alpha [Moraxella nonliquefaciens]|jgi:integration host factor subunit alpha|uniref:Integration host factor subunit alpha n=2 Tax=Moraxella nonliquefaciens TaxID=478 RepID=A0A1B8PJU9_MORNO|nr:integration host factor subunit alpha [Moraxella nonliquefaciens]MCG7412294.1 integration host factor subunit alpha [Moraxella nonliquefaciens]MDI4498292.1 integration host factor subunit alpha [Moraxella nonliquefaciens]MDI4500106.1 integration host factor subunit alpha [Moraxella nonliquefaciens]OBX50681.1 integration host factor subunit alpha [Moraxella nonliquefaciens]OBX50855.1 integration host factor subunit alpha [Moraxella nonliquefaciens]